MAERESPIPPSSDRSLPRISIDEYHEDWRTEPVPRSAPVEMPSSGTEKSPSSREPRTVSQHESEPDVPNPTKGSILPTEPPPPPPTKRTLGPKIFWAVAVLVVAACTLAMLLRR